MDKLLNETTVRIVGPCSNVKLSLRGIALIIDDLTGDKRKKEVHLLRLDKSLEKKLEDETLTDDQCELIKQIQFGVHQRYGEVAEKVNQHSGKADVADFAEKETGDV